MGMMKTEVRIKYVPRKKLRMTIEGRMGVTLVMSSLAFIFGGQNVLRRIISILDFHVMAILARRREAQHIPGIGWVCAFSFLI